MSRELYFTPGPDSILITYSVIHATLKFQPIGDVPIVM